MKSSLYRLLVLAVLVAAVSLPALAQGVISAAISGTVTSSKGEPLVGANIIAVHEPTGSRFGTMSRDDGHFNVANLRPGGPYTITISYVGYRSQVRKDVFVDLGQNLSITPELTEEAIQAQEVVVTGAGNAIMSPSKMGSTSVVGRQQLDKLPSISRNFEDYYKLSPYFSGSNAAGRNRNQNNIQIDGANYNDLFGLGGTTPGSQSQSTPMSLDAIEQFQIEVSPYDVRKAGFTGAGINAITRSGSNTLNGSAFYYGRNQALTGLSPINPDVLKTKLANYSDYQAGFRLGGPIMKDELFFFVNGEVTAYTEPLIRTFGAATDGTNQFTLPVDSLDKFMGILKNTYGYDPGVYQSMDNKRTSNKFFGRIDWNLSNEHRLTVRHSYLKATYDNSPSRGRGATDIYFTNNRYSVDNITNSTALNLKSVFGNNMANELIVGFTTQYDRPKFYGSAFPMLDVTMTSASGRSYRVLAGAEQFRHKNELDQEVIEATDNFSYFMGDHTFTAGLRLESFTFRNLFIPNNFGSYVFTSLDNFRLGQVAANGYTYQYAMVSPNNPSASQTYAIRWHAVTYGGYVQDEWQVLPTLRLNAGVRFDMYTYPQKPAYNYKVDSTFAPVGFDFATNKPPASYLMVSPRIGFNYDVTGDRSTQLRGGVGVFSGRVPYVWVSNQYGNTGVEYATITGDPNPLNNGGFNAFQPNPNAQWGIGTNGLTPTATYEIDITNPNFKNPSILRYSLAVDQKLPYDFIATIEGMVAQNINDIVYQDANLKSNTLNTNGGLTPGGKLIGENREVWGTWSTASRRWTRNLYNTTFTNVIYLKNASKGGQQNFSFQLNRSGAADGVDVVAGYTWGQSKDLNSGNSTTAISQWRFNPVPGNPNDPPLSYSAWDRRHRIYTSVSYRFDWGKYVGFDGLASTFGLFYEGRSGRGFSYVVNGDVNGDGRTDNDLAYVPKDASDIYLVTSGGVALAKSDVAYQQLLAFIADDPYLNSRRGKMSERMGAREPWIDQLDFRFTQEVPTTFGQKVELYLDVLNVLNLLNADKGWQKTVANQNTFLLNFYGINNNVASPDYGRPMYSWAPKDDPRIPENISSRWQMQLGARITF